MAPQHLQSLHSDTTDLGALWTNAVNDYMKKTGKDMNHLRAQSIGDVMKVTEGSLKTFGGFRHDDGKIEKVRSAFSRHLEDIQMVVNGLEKVGAAVGAFPPAMPVGIVFAACGHLLSAFAGVKADYDRVEAFFEHSGRFFERLSILENQADSGPLAVAIIRVFSAQLSICGLVEAMIKAKRFKQWLNALWNLEDQDLAAAYATMQASIEELGATVGYASYSAIRITQESVGEVHDKVEELDKNIRQFRSTLTESVQAIYASNLDLTLQISDGFVSMQAKQDKSHAIQLQLVRQQEKILRAVENRTAGQKASLKLKRSGDAAENKVQALGRIKSFFEERTGIYSGFEGGLAANSNRAQDTNIRQAILPGTTTWLFEETYVDSWLNGDIPILCIRGSDGVGKSFLAYSVRQRLLSDDTDGSNTAYFYLRADASSGLTRMEDAFACCAVQIAESNGRYAQHVAAKLREDAFKPKDIPTWTRFFTSVFKSGTQNLGRLYLVFDGLDETEETEREIFMKFLKEVREEGTLVSVLVTSRPEGSLDIDCVEPSVVEVTKAKIVPDLKMIVQYRLRTLPRLSKLRPVVKKTILRMVVARADCILYVEHMLRRLSDLGREDFVLRALFEMPTTLLDLYKLLLEECGRDRSDAQFYTLKALFAWLAFSNKDILLSDVWHIVKSASPDSESTLDLEGEIIGRSSRILELSGDFASGDPFDDVDADADSDEEVINVEDCAAFAPTVAPSLSFQDRSLRHYFRTAPATLDHSKDLRTPAYDAHVLILTMCADMLKRGQFSKRRDTHHELIPLWHEHFLQVQPEDASDDIVGRVVSSLHCIFSHCHRQPMLFSAPELYSPTSSDTKQWYDHVVAWARNSTSLPPGSVAGDVSEWAADVDTAHIVFTLARSLFVAWAESDDLWRIMKAWRPLLLAYDLYILLRSKEDVSPLLSAEEKILLVADTFEPGKKSWKTLRAIGATMSQPENDEPELSIWLHYGKEKNLSFLRQSLDLIETPCMEKIDLLRLVVESHDFGDDWESQVAYLNDALDIFSSLESGDMSEDERAEFQLKRQDVLLNKIRALRYASETEVAFEMLESAIEDRGSGRIWPRAFSAMEDLCQSLDSSGRKFIGVLKSWPEREWYQWFDLRYSYRLDPEDLRKFARWTKANTEDDFLLREFFVAIEKLALENKNSVCTARVRSVLAYLHQMVLGNVEKAKALRLAIVTTKLEPDSWVADNIKESIVEEWIRLACTIHSEFQASTDLDRRESLLKEMRELPRIHTNDDLKDAHVGMLMGDMLRIIGPAREYYRYMNEAFETCTAGLEDTVLYNDGPSLRLLAKLLSFLDGLERDAQIAYSAQYSILDRSVEDDERGPNHHFDRTLASDTSIDSHTSECQPSDPLDSLLRTPPQNEQDEAAEASNPRTSTVTPVVTEPTSEEPATPNAADDRQLWMTDEDRSGYSPVCDGCSFSDDGTYTILQDTWCHSMYLCLTCPSTDMCESCFEREVKGRRAGAEPDPAFIYLCEANHRYMKGPIKGWKGIKNGVIRIGDEELPVTEWIRGLKEARWKKAWETYWLSHGRKGDIVDSD